MKAISTTRQETTHYMTTFRFWTRSTTTPSPCKNIIIHTQNIYFVLAFAINMAVSVTYFTAFGQGKTTSKKKHDAPW